MKPTTKRRFLVFAVVLIGLVAAGTVPIPYIVSSPCIIQPSAVWHITQDGAGQLITGWEHNLLDAGAPRALLQFDRPDFVEVSVSAGLREGSSVQVGDTVGVIVSREGLGQSMILETELRAAEVELDRLLAGARIEDIDVAERKVEMARVALDAFRPEMDRISSQYEAGVVTLSILQETKGRFQLLEAELRLAEAQLTALRASAHPDELALARVEIERLNKSIERIKYTTGMAQPLIAPISGRVSMGCGEGVLLKIERQDTLAVITFLPEAIIEFLDKERPVEIKLTAGNSTVLHGVLNRIDFTGSNQLGQYEGPYGITLIANHNGRFQSGMTGRTRLETGSRTLLSVLRDKF